jgi:hypothetical protein
MMRFVHQGIGIQPRICHDSVDKLIYDRNDAIDATEFIVEAGLFCWLHPEPPCA